MSLKNKRVLLTYGPTWVKIDQVRVISNISSGELGKALARLFKKEGAKLTALQGPVQDPLRDPSLKIINFRYFEDLKRHLTSELKRKYDIVVHAAAVSDYRPAKSYRGKLDSQRNSWTLALLTTPKLIARIKKLNPSVFLVGFKLEPGMSIKNAPKNTRALFTKGQCDLVVANNVDAKKYSGYILDRRFQMLAQAGSRGQMARRLIKVIQRMA